MRRALVLAACVLAGGVLTAQQPPPRDPARPSPRPPAPAPAQPQVSFADQIAKLEAAVAAAPDKVESYYALVTAYEEKVRRDTELLAADKWTYLLKGLDAADRALAIDPNHRDTLIFKGILLRHQAVLEPDPGQKKALIAEADAVRNRAIEMSKGSRPMAAAGAPMPPPPPPPPGADSAPGTPCQLVPPDGQAPVRVGGNIQAPTKTRDVRPVYPPDAQAARVVGVVILEALIAPSGEVSNACVLRSIPMLDQAALDAVLQWQFTPTLLNGNPVPVIMTVTVNFTLQ